MGGEKFASKRMQLSLRNLKLLRLVAFVLIWVSGCGGSSPLRIVYFLGVGFEGADPLLFMKYVLFGVKSTHWLDWYVDER